MFKKLLILVLSICFFSLVGCGGSGSSNTHWDTYQVFSSNLLQEAEDTTNLNDYKDTTIYFTNKFAIDKTLKNWDEESKFSFKSSKFFSENLEENTDDEFTKETYYYEEEGTLTFGNHNINKSSRDYLLQIFEIDNLADLDGQTYYISAQGYKADNGQLYLDIINIEKK